MLFQLPDGNWIDPATVTGIRYCPREQVPGDGHPFPDCVYIDWRGTYSLVLGDDRKCSCIQFPDAATALAFRNSLAARVNAPAEAAVLAEQERIFSLIRELLCDEREHASLGKYGLSEPLEGFCRGCDLIAAVRARGVHPDAVRIER